MCGGLGGERGGGKTNLERRMDVLNGDCRPVLNQGGMVEARFMTDFQRP